MSRGATRPRKRARTPSPLVNLCPDLLGIIVDHLDRAAAVTLALTCSTIRPIAERAIWKELNISVHRTFMPGATSWNQYRPLGGNRLFAIREEHIWGTAETSDPSHPPRPNESRSGLGPHKLKPATESSLARYYLDLIAHLQADPVRLTSVRSIFVDLDRLLHPLFADLLHLVAPTVRHLHFHPPGFPYEPNEAFRSVSLRGMFDLIGPSVTFDNVRTLYLPLADDWSETVLTTLRATPHLRSLTIAVEQPYSGSWGATTEFAPASAPPDGWHVLEDLETLCVEEMASAFEEFVVALMKGSRGVRRVTIRDPAQTWRLEAGNELIDVLASAPGLRYVACPRSVLLKNVKDKYQDVEELAVAEERQAWGLPALEAVSIPPLPHLKALYSYARIDEARSITCAWNGESRGLPPAIRPISPTTLQAIQSASSLLYIQIPGSPTREFGIPATNAEWEYWGSKASAKKHDRAVLIRTYTHEGTGEVFTHCRGYSAHHSHIEDGIIHRTEDVWEEYVDYMGVCPPAGVLGEVYAAMGGDGEAGWKVPGRGLRMSKKAWEVLRHWAAEASTAKEPGIVAGAGGMVGGLVII